jgi:ferrochelatase
MSQRYDAILIVGFGGPTRLDEVRPFLQNLAAGRPIPSARLEEVAHHYEVIGGSPYNELTMKQADALRTLLAHKGPALPVYAGMRNWAPYVSEAMTAIARSGARHIFCFPMAPHRSQASWDRYRQTVSAALADLGREAPAVDYPEPWHTHPLFVDAVASRIHDVMAALAAHERDRAQVIFTAHSIPAEMDAQSGYAAQVAQSCRLVAQQLGLERWTVAYQSRNGNPRDPWLEPDVTQVLSGLAGQSAVVMPIGFVCDHVEVLYDLDIEAARIARAAGVAMRRAATVGDHPQFIRMIAELVSCGSIASRDV